MNQLPEQIADILDQLTLFALIWSIGGALEEGSRKGFNSVVMKLMGGSTTLHQQQQLDLQFEVEYTPPKVVSFYFANVFDLVYNQTSNQWLNWTDVGGGAGGRKDDPRFRARRPSS